MAEGQRDKSIIHQLPNGFSFKLCRVKGGSFQMGSDEYNDEHPIHTVYVPSFYLAECPVTQEFWLNLDNSENPSSFYGLQRPVEQVSWFESAAFCNQLNSISGYPPIYYIDKTFQKPLSMIDAHKIKSPISIYIFTIGNDPSFRLPSEAEWEYAARGGGQVTGHFIHSGGEKLDEGSWYNENSYKETKEIGLKLPNELGLYDMNGNVWEWCEDQYHRNYIGAPRDGSAWNDLKADARRVLRGGSWDDDSETCRSSARSANLPNGHSSDVGFRLAFHLPPASSQPTNSFVGHE